ncbi:MAG: LCP family protein, partial [Actinomycetota bacterium]
YSVGFVDPHLWAEGRFPTLPELFAADARSDALRRVGDLTLGRAALHLDAVQPMRARLDVRFLLDRAGRPLVALAGMEFTGVGLADGADVSVRHEGDYVLRRSEGRWRIVSFDVRSRVPSPALIHRKVRQASFSPRLPSSDLLFVLVIGSDARPGQQMTATRADSIHIIGVNPRKGVASILGIPRDSYAYMPGVGMGKINGALVYGGPDLMVRTVERLTGIHIDAYALTGFEGFVRMIEAIGTIGIDIPYAMNDRGYSGAHFRAGPTRLSGRQALALARNRHDAPGGDFGRSMNQGRLIIAALEEFRSDLQKDPLTLLRWAVAVARYLRTDLSLSEMVELFLVVPSFRPGQVRNQVVSGSGAMVGGQSVIYLGASARARFRDLAADAMLGR